jgi:hypothetical protein
VVPRLLATEAARCPSPSQTRMVYSAAAIESAEKNARLPIDDPRWKATTVYEFAND